LKKVVLTTLFLLCAACVEQQVRQNEKPLFHTPKDFSIRYLRGGDPVRGTLLFTEYTANADGRVVVISKYIREIQTEERQLTPEQLSDLEQRIDKAGLFAFAQREDLSASCEKRETDQPRSELELQWEGRTAKIIGNFDPQRCPEVRELKQLSADLPPLFEGSLVRSEHKKVPWPGDIKGAL
jgi:hypothetical protein